MITIIDSNEYRLYKRLLNEMVACPPREGKVIRESFVVTSLEQNSDNANSKVTVDLKSKKIYTEYDYKSTFPNVEESLINLELDYWTGEFFSDNRIPNIVSNLEKDPESKRHVVTLWDNHLHLDENSIAPSTIYFYFRVVDNRLDLYTHARTSNVYFLTLMDIHIFRGLQQAIADKINKKVGNLNQVYDSLLVFNKDWENIVNQLSLIDNSPLWNNLCQM
ncbi:MAG: hypothetical protein ACD_19C00150G0001 [uncultured bacterium]|nr:MAG: hypothetical protein ACD_19C00150G0001 [uncultured bacterium]